jgi:hypothetical protein
LSSPPNVRRDSEVEQQISKETDQSRRNYIQTNKPEIYNQIEEEKKREGFWHPGTQEPIQRHRKGIQS